VLKFTPEQFRMMTIVEFNLAFDGYAQANGIKKPSEKFVSRNELLDAIGK
jgi:ferritin